MDDDLSQKTNREDQKKIDVPQDVAVFVKSAPLDNDTDQKIGVEQKKEEGETNVKVSVDPVLEKESFSSPPTLSLTSPVSSVPLPPNMETMSPSKSQQSVPPPIVSAGFTNPVDAQPIGKKSSGGGFKNLWLILLLLILLVGGGVGMWWMLNRGVNKNEVVTLNYWGVNESEKVLQPFFDRYMEANPNITIKYVNNSSIEYRQRLSSQLANENPKVDVFRFHNTWVPMLKNYLSVVPDSVFSSDEYKKVFYPVVRKDLKLNTGYAGIPLFIDGLGLYYNEDILIEAGVDPPKNWNEFKAVAARLTVRDKSKIIRIAGTSMGLTNNVDHWSDILAILMLQTKAKLANPNNKVGQEALTFYTMFARTMKVWDKNMPDSTTAFATGRVGMYFGPAWKAPIIKEIANKNSVNLRFKVIPIPQLLQTNVTWASYWVEGVSNKSDSAVQKAGWDLLKYLSQKDTLEQLYQVQVQDRGFGLPYSRVDLGNQLKNHPQLGAFILQAPAARSWYLASDTTDKKGIDDQIIKYYRDAVNKMVSSGKAADALKPVEKGVEKVLKNYGVN